MAEFKYLGTAVTNQNRIYEEIKSRFNSGNTCYHSRQRLLSFHPLSKSLKNKMHETIILTFVLYGYETWSFTREQRRLRVYEKRELREYLDIRGRKWREVSEDCTVRT
jgi:hypothetical protein